MNHIMRFIYKELLVRKYCLMEIDGNKCLAKNNHKVYGLNGFWNNDVEAVNNFYFSYGAFKKVTK